MDKKIELIHYLDSILDVTQVDIFSKILPTLDPVYREYCTDSFAQFYQGLMLMNGTDLSNIGCACFLSMEVLTEALKKNINFIIVKHPLDWQELPGAFLKNGEDLYNYCGDHEISIYVAHSAMDRHPLFSPTMNFTKALGFDIHQNLNLEEDIFGCLAREKTNYHALLNKVQSATGLCRLQELQMNQDIDCIAIVAGGGDSIDYLSRAIKQGCDTYITGIAYCDGNEYSRKHNPKFIDLARNNEINLIGASHYMTEKFGIEALCQFLNSKQLPTLFLEEPQKIAHLKQSWGFNFRLRADIS